MRRLIKKIIKLKSSNNAVSEVLGTVLLLGIAVAIFSVLYFVVLSQTFETNETYPTIVSTYVGNNIVFENRGGESIGLDAEVPLTIDGQRVLINDETPTVGDLLIDINGNGLWDIGENLVLDFDEIDYNITTDSKEVDATAINEEKTDTIFMGSLDIHPTSDIGIHCSVNNSTPRVGEKVELTIIISHFRGSLNLSGLKINFLLPNGLEYNQSNTNSGSYNNATGDWILDELGIRQSATLTIIADVTSLGTISKFTQLAMVLDGSGSIGSTDFGVMKEGLAKAIEDYLPYTSMVELTVVHFASYHANVEVGPIVITDDPLDPGYDTTVANQIRAIPYRGGYTPLACGLYLAADTLKNSPNYDADYRQVINVVTDGVPNVDADLPDYPHNGSYVGETAGKTAAETAQAYMINHLAMTNDGSQFDGDELDAEAIDFPAASYTWLKENIVWPQPGYDNWPPTGPGWIRSIGTYQKFADTIGEQFEMLFSNMYIEAEMIQSSPIIDITIQVNDNIITIMPQE